MGELQRAAKENQQWTDKMATGRFTLQALIQMGDFKYSDIYWESSTATSVSRKHARRLVECTEVLIQVIAQPEKKLNRNNKNNNDFRRLHSVKRKDSANRAGEYLSLLKENLYWVSFFSPVRPHHVHAYRETNLGWGGKDWHCLFCLLVFEGFAIYKLLELVWGSQSQLISMG